MFYNIRQLSRVFQDPIRFPYTATHRLYSMVEVAKYIFMLIYNPQRLTGNYSRKLLIRAYRIHHSLCRRSLSHFGKLYINVRKNLEFYKLYYQNGQQNFDTTRHHARKRYSRVCCNKKQFVCLARWLSQRTNVNG